MSESAFPWQCDGFGEVAPEVHVGLTKREYFAAQIMSAKYARLCEFNRHDAAREAVDGADALLAALRASDRSEK